MTSIADTLGSAHLAWLNGEEQRLLAFAHAVVREDGMANWLASDGSADPGKPAATWITCRMAHVHYLAALRGIPGARATAERLLHGIDTMARDPEHGGWLETAESSPDDDKLAYTAAFVVIASGSAAIAGDPDGVRILRDALAVIDRLFGDAARPLIADRVSGDGTTVDPYRGINANMHFVEALLTAWQALGDDALVERAVAICRFVADQAAGNGWRIPEHFDAAWAPQPEYHADSPADQFRPYGATVGHALEWSRLLLQADAHLEGGDDLTAAAVELYRHAVADGWARNGRPGFLYTTGWDGTPVISDRLHWVAAEAVGAAAALYQATGETEYLDDYLRWLDYADAYFLDREFGSWIHQLDPTNVPSTTIWEGKPDIYHAYQAVILPMLPLAASPAGAILAARERAGGHPGRRADGPARRHPATNSG